MSDPTPASGEDILKRLLGRLGGDETELEIYRVARSKPAGEERDAYLQEACGRDDSLRERVQTLLDHPVEGDRSELPERVGPYRILERIGEGGMGEVYSAEQIEPVRRRVALKVIKLGMDTREIIARFDSERQALALMNHPGIARMLDAGSTSDGRPYFVMEHVAGIPVTTYCDRRAMSLDARLELFGRVCAAVQHAHQKGVIHRDLKPSNILVTEEGGEPVPKVIDFGIAKATGPRLTEATLFTEVGRLIGTPEYMSPEQAEGSSLDVDTRADVYSLGVILYELVCGLRPFDLRRPGLGPLEIRRILLETEPASPSTRFDRSGELAEEIAESRDTTSAALRRTIRGELDAVILQAMQKDRSRRYATAEALAQDVAHFRSGHPVSARPDTLLYRLRKLARRHRLASSVAAAFLLVIVGFGAMMAVQARLVAKERDRANREAQVSQEVADFLAGIFEVADPEQARGETVTAREVLDAGAREIDERMPEPTPVRARLKQVMGGVYQNLGLYPEAIELMQDALDTSRDVNGPDHPETLRAMNDLGSLYFSMDRLDEAEAVLAETLERKRAVFDPHSWEVMATVGNLANVYYLRGDLEKAGPMYREAIDIRIGVGGPDDEQALMTMINLANVENRLGRPDEGAVLLARANEGLTALRGEDDPVVLGVRYLAATANGSRGDFEGARDGLEEVLRARERVLGEDHPDTIWTRASLASTYEQLGDRERAEEIYRDVLERRRRVLGDEHTDVARARGTLAELLLEEDGRAGEAKELLEAALATYRTTLGEGHTSTQEARLMLAMLAERRADRGEVEKHLRVAVNHGLDVAHVETYLPSWSEWAASLEGAGDALRGDP